LSLIHFSAIYQSHFTSVQKTTGKRRTNLTRDSTNHLVLWQICIRTIIIAFTLGDHLNMKKKA